LRKIYSTAAFIVILGLFTAAAAAPMLCSNEKKTCIDACRRLPAALVGNCIAACRTHFNYCRQTGCWDDGKTRYCGLGRR